MIERIIFLLEGYFSQRDYQRFGIETLRENGFDVEIWDMTPTLYANYSRVYSMPDCRGLSIFNDRQQAYERLSNLTSSDFVVNFVSYYFWNLWVYSALSKSSASYAVFCANAIPVAREIYLQKKREVLKNLFSMKSTTLLKHIYMKIPFRFLGIKPVSFIFAGGSKCMQYHYPISKDTEVLWIHTLDYDIYLKEKSRPCPGRDIAVFIDEFLPLHHEYAMFKLDPPIEVGKYFTYLDRFFESVERKTGYEVVIAECPEANYEDTPDYFRGRKRFKGQTAGLVHESKLVLGHYSTALNFANLFQKPVISMSCSDFRKKPIEYHIQEIAKWFGKSPIFIDETQDIDWEFELNISKEHYDNYRNAYIKTENSQDLPFWQIVANRLKKGF
ncbi:MAG: hypothetical protein PHU49_00135 [Syntrophorhabdaceae bacterium]|nr:hypothetical protein [Syntrophorhabdaceae bacterium]MDD5242399.1 hypothetical protein [Syntrophorhabdaceae bacterium]